MASIYMTWPNAAGDVTEAGHQGWIALEGVGMAGAVTCSAPMVVGRGAESRAAGVPSYPPIQFRIKRSPATIALLKSLFNNVAAMDVQIDYLGANQKVTRTIKLRSVRVTDLDGLLDDYQRLTAMYTAICMLDFFTGPDGKVAESPKNGLNLLTGKELVW